MVSFFALYPPLFYILQTHQLIPTPPFLLSFLYSYSPSSLLVYSSLSTHIPPSSHIAPCLTHFWEDHSQYLLECCVKPSAGAPFVPLPLLKILLLPSPSYTHIACRQRRKGVEERETQRERQRGRERERQGVRREGRRETRWFGCCYRYAYHVLNPNVPYPPPLPPFPH